MSPMARRTRARNALGIVGREGDLKLEPLGLQRRSGKEEGNPGSLRGRGGVCLRL